MASVFEVAKFFVDLAQKQEGDLMTPLRLQKLLYFAQAWHLARHGTPLFDAPIEAWQYGPVVPDVYRKYNHFGREGIEEDSRVAPDAFTSNEFALLLDVAREYAPYSTSALVDLTHKAGAPWACARKSCAIQPEDIKSYFVAQTPLASFDSVLSDYPVEEA